MLTKIQREDGDGPFQCPRCREYKSFVPNTFRKHFKSCIGGGNPTVRIADEVISMEEQQNNFGNAGS